MRNGAGEPLSSSANTLLRRLMPADQLLLSPFITPVVFGRGAVLYSPGELFESIYFPENLIVSLGEQLGGAGHIEVAVVGSEGMIGWPALLGCDHTSNSAIAQTASGAAACIPRRDLMASCAKSMTLSASLRSFIHLIIAQMAGSIASHLHDPLGRRLARWLLMRHDRLVGDVLLVQHDEIAHSLNVRRASITDGLHHLEGEKFIRCNRGKITIRDRPHLEAFAGAAYGTPEALYRQLIAPFGKSR